MQKSATFFSYTSQEKNALTKQKEAILVKTGGSIDFSNQVTDKAIRSVETVLPDDRMGGSGNNHSLHLSEAHRKEMLPLKKGRHRLPGLSLKYTI
jgi:hypothetical protein